MTRSSAVSCQGRECGAHRQRLPCGRTSFGSAQAGTLSPSPAAESDAPVLRKYDQDSKDRAIQVDPKRHSRFGYRINVLIGGNGAGKSNVLEAVGVLSAAVDRGLGDSDLRKKGVRLTPPELMKSAFKNYDLPRTLQLTAEMEGGVIYRINLTGKEEDPLLSFFSESCAYKGKRVFGQGPNGARVLGNSISGTLRRHRGIWDQVRTAFRFPPAVETALRSLSEYAIYSPQTDFLRGMQAGTVDTPPIGLHGEGLPQAVLGLIDQVHEARRRHESSTGGEDSALVADLKNRSIELAFLPKWSNVVRVGRIEKHLISRALVDQGDQMVYFVDQFMHGRRRTLVRLRQQRGDSLSVVHCNSTRP